MLRLRGRRFVLEAPHRSFTTVRVEGPDLTLGVPLFLFELFLFGRAKVYGSMDRTILRYSRRPC